jgi:single-stranded DNA-binding protein
MVTGRLHQRSWETPEGEKRSVAEIEADEVGVSLKWATAEVERASQSGNGDRNAGRERQAERGGAFWSSRRLPAPRRAACAEDPALEGWSMLRDGPGAPAHPLVLPIPPYLLPAASASTRPLP